MSEIIRFASITDSSEILAIYAKYILETPITFEVEVPPHGEFEQRISSIMSIYPYLVYEVDNKIAGYAYASRYRDRAAFRYDVEVSVYFSEHCHGKGGAKALYLCLFEILKKQGYYNAYAAYTEPNIKSRRFHEKLGFEKIGTFHNVGYKFGKWHDVTWAGKQLIPHTIVPTPTRKISDIPSGFFTALFEEHTAK